MDAVIVRVGHKDTTVVVTRDSGGGEVPAALVVGWTFKCKLEQAIAIKNDNSSGTHRGLVCYANVTVDVFSNSVRSGEKSFVVFKLKNFFEFQVLCVFSNKSPAVIGCTGAIAVRHANKEPAIGACCYTTRVIRQWIRLHSYCRNVITNKHLLVEARNE